MDSVHELVNLLGFKGKYAPGDASCVPKSVEENFFDLLSSVNEDERRDLISKAVGGFVLKEKALADCGLGLGLLLPKVIRSRWVEYVKPLQHELENFASDERIASWTDCEDQGSGGAAVLQWRYGSSLWNILNLLKSNKAEYLYSRVQERARSKQFKMVLKNLRGMNQ